MLVAYKIKTKDASQPQVVNGHSTLLQKCLEKLVGMNDFCSAKKKPHKQKEIIKKATWPGMAQSALFSLSDAPPNVMYFPQRDTCNLEEDSIGRAQWK